jgi:hypothetical protein
MSTDNSVWQIKTPRFINTAAAIVTDLEAVGRSEDPAWRDDGAAAQMVLPPRERNLPWPRPWERRLAPHDPRTPTDATFLMGENTVKDLICTIN